MAEAIALPQNCVMLDGVAMVAMTRARVGISEITDECAKAIMASWMAPTGVGATFSAIVHGFPCDYEYFRDDLLGSYREAIDAQSRLELDMLGTWALAQIRVTR